MNSVGSPMQCSLGRRVTRPPMTTFLHINRALDVFGAIIVAFNEKETLLSLFSTVRRSTSSQQQNRLS